LKAQGFILSALIALGATMPIARANLIISATFDSSLNSAEQGAINTAISLFENTYTNNVTVSIYFQAGGGLGQSNFFVYDETYTSVYNALVATNANPAAIAALNASGGDALTNGGVNPVGGTNDIEIKSANARALGIAGAPGPGCNVTPTNGGNIPNDCAGGSDTTGETPTGIMVDGIISLNTGLTDPPGNSSDYDLTEVAEHEMDEVLGLGSAFENCDTNNPSGACQPGATLTLANDTPYGVGTLQDLYRWSSLTGGTRVTSISCSSPGNAFFAYGPNGPEINQDNNACNSGDFGDWSNNGYVQSAFGTPGTPGAAYSTSELDAMSSIGYGVSNAAPEPSTLGLLGGSLVALAFLRRRLSRS
jgi:hypothetical protein